MEYENLSALTLFVLQQPVEIEFDAAKDRENLAKHGVSLALGAGMDMDQAIIEDDLFSDPSEYRFTALGPIGSDLFLMAATFRRGGHVVRVISLRKAEKHERRHYRETYGA